MSSGPKIIVVLGPTASGKSDLAVFLAKKFSTRDGPALGWNGAEIISADSRQVYKGLDIGSGKITKEEMQGIPHYLIDVASPKRVFTAAQYKDMAEKDIKLILKRKKLPIICGGTGFYIDSLINDLHFPAVPPDIKLRKKLDKEDVFSLLNRLRKLDPRRAKNIDKNNKRRLVRALEIVLKTGKPVPKTKTKSRFKVLKIGIKRSLAELKSLIHKRLVKRIDEGLIEEVAGLIKNGVSQKRLFDLGLEYRYVSLYLKEKGNPSAPLRTKQAMLRKLESEVVKYAKRQLTWFKRDKKINWVVSTQQAENLTRDFLAY